MKTYKEFILECQRGQEINEVIGPIIRGVSMVAKTPLGQRAISSGVSAATKLVRGAVTGAGIAGGASATKYTINKAKEDPDVRQTKSNIEKSVGSQRGFQTLKKLGLGAVERYAKMGQ